MLTHLRPWCIAKVDLQVSKVPVFRYAAVRAGISTANVQVWPDPRRPRAVAAPGDLVSAPVFRSAAAHAANSEHQVGQASRVRRTGDKQVPDEMVVRAEIAGRRVVSMGARPRARSERAAAVAASNAKFFTPQCHKR